VSNALKPTKTGPQGRCLTAAYSRSTNHYERRGLKSLAVKRMPITYCCSITCREEIRNSMILKMSLKGDTREGSQWSRRFPLRGPAFREDVQRSGRTLLRFHARRRHFAGAEAGRRCSSPAGGRAGSGFGSGGNSESRFPVAGRKLKERIPGGCGAPLANGCLALELFRFEQRALRRRAGRRNGRSCGNS